MTTTVDPEHIRDDMRRTGTPDVRVVVAAGVAAGAFDMAVRSGVASLGGALCVVAVATAMAWTGRVRNPQAMAALALAPAFGVFLALRTSPWLLVPDLVAAAVLLAVAASFSRGGSVVDVTVTGVVRRAWDGLLHAVAAPAFLAASFPRADRRGAAVVRGVVLAAPIVLFLGLLLSSADEVFASVFDVSFDAGPLMTHIVLCALGAWGMATLLRTASHPAPADKGARPPRLGQVETCIVLGSLVALYAAFAVTQAVVAADGARHVLETAGLTYAEYARSGFFELLAVAALTLVLLLALDNGTKVVRWLSLAAVALTLLIVAVAVRRLHLYEQAFGLTMLRLYSAVFAVWVGAVFMLLAARLAGVGAPRRWFASAAVGLGLAVVLVLNLVDPEAMVVRRNADRPDFDAPYGATLSDDAVPALVQAGAREAACDRPVAFGRPQGWVARNRARDRAAAACAQP